jgi:signal transduction histidine kinase
MLTSSAVESPLRPSSSYPTFVAARRIARRHASLLAVASASALIVADYLTGVEVMFTLLYLVPLSFAAWWRGRTFGFVVATFCAAGALGGKVLQHLQDVRPFHVGRLVWNHGGSFVIFLICAYLIARLREYTDEDARKQRLTMDQLRQAERLGVLGQLAAGLAHELGTPLNVIHGYAELIASDRMNPSNRNSAAKTILAQTRKMTSIIRSLLDLSRRDRAERAPVALEELIRQAASLLRPMATEKKINIALEGDPGQTVRVLGNRTELEQVLLNLMMNGIQAMSPGGTLRLLARRKRESDHDDGGVAPMSLGCLVVEDEGTGIPSENLPQIFDPFFTTKDVGQGTGLGLSVSYGIVRDHGGSIEVSSVVGAGSRFSVYLPLAS